jgi:6-phospho-beta-glucosidase
MRDEKIPPQFDMVGNESLGAGGIINLLRTLPVVFEFAETIQEVNPKALFINVTNPVGSVVEALFRYSSLKVVGVSDLPGIYSRKIADLLGREPEAIQVNFVGIFDLGWIQDVKVDGLSRMNQLLSHIENSEDDDLDHGLIRLFRMIPTRALGMYFHRQEILKQQQKCARFRSEILYDMEKRLLKMYQKPTLNTVPDLARTRNAHWYEYTLIPLLQQFESDEPANNILCVENKGSITDLPDGCSVEVPVCITAKGVKPRKVGMLPRFLKGLFCSLKESDRLAIEAVKHNSYDNALQALAVNPFVPSLTKAKDLLDRVIRQEHFNLR